MLFFCEFLWLADFFLCACMNQYLIHAFDAKDKNAGSRRLETRSKHLEIIKTLKQAGNFISGGAILNDSGEMIGSNLVLQFETSTELDNYLSKEPYILNKVWKKIKVYPFKFLKEF